MNCPKCNYNNVENANFCSRCSEELFKFKEIIKKSSKDIVINDLIDYFGTISTNNKVSKLATQAMTVYSMTNYVFSKSNQKLFNNSSITALQTLNNIMSLGYFLRLTEDSIVKEEIDYSKIPIKPPDESKRVEEWIKYNAFNMASNELQNADEILKYALLVKADIIAGAMTRLFRAFAIPMFQEEAGKILSEEKIISDFGEQFMFDILFGYWLRFFENVYNFLKN